MAMNLGALGAGVAAASPGIQQGIGALQQNSANKNGQAIATDMSQQNQTLMPDLAAGTASSDADNSALQAALHPMADPNHPMWPVLNAAAGAAPQSGIPGMSKGGVVTPVSKQPPTGPLPANFGGAKNYQNGGPVRGNNYGALTNRPEFTKGPAIPVDANGVKSADLGGVHGMTGYAGGGTVDHGGNTSMGQGITPASPEGQVLTMDEGGAVPTSQANFMPQTPALAPPAYSRAAGFASGIQAGESIGHNLQEQWHQNQARRALAAQQETERQTAESSYRKANGMPPMESESNGGPMDRLHSIVNNFSSMLGFHSHDENGTQPHPQLVPPTPASPSGALPAPAAGPAAAPPAPPQALAAPGVTGGPAPTGGAPGVPGAPPAAAPAAPAQPGAGGAPSTPPAAAAAKGQQTAAAAGAPPEQAAATGAQVAATTAALAQPPQRSPDNQTPKGAYSMAPTDFLHMENAKYRAAEAAAMAGLDPTKVYSALSAQQTAHFQGQYLMQIGRAQQAMQLGHYDDMEKYLKNAGYYLPNGQDIEFKKAGDLSKADQDKLGPDIDPSTRLVTNPFYGMAGHQGEPQYVPLNPITLGSFAQTAMDPRAFAQGQMDMLRAGREYEVNLKKAAAQQTAATGTLLRGRGIFEHSLNERAEVPAIITDKRAHADMEEATAAWRRSLQGGTGGGVKIKPSDIAKSQEQAARSVDESFQGELETTSPYMLDDKGQPMKDPATQQPIPNPHGNQPTRNPQKVSPVFQGFNNQERDEIRDTAGMFLAGNMGTMTPQGAAETAALYERDQQSARRGQLKTHNNPKTGKPEKDVVIYNDHGNPAIRLWNGNGYIHAWLSPNIDQSGGAIDAGGAGAAPGIGGMNAGEEPGAATGSEE